MPETIFTFHKLPRYDLKSVVITCIHKSRMEESICGHLPKIEHKRFHNALAK